MTISDSKNFFHISKSQYFYWLFFMLICFFSYYYTDIEVTTRHGINIWKSLFEGKLFQFYSYNANPSLFDISLPAFYDIPIYIIFAIWNFPLYIIELITKQNSLIFVPCILYSKGLLILFLWLTTKSFKKICGELKFSKEKTETCTFFWVTSLLVTEPLFVICQYDIICLFFILNGILSYMKNDTKKFLICFSLAIPLKMLAIFVFVPLLLIKEKNIFKILLAVICCTAPLLICKSIFIITDSAYTNRPYDPTMSSILYIFVDNTTWNLPISLDSTISNTFNFPLGKPTVFFTIYFSFLLFCYFFVNKISTFSILIISAVSLSIMFVFLFCSPYWIILISPFCSLLCFYTENKFILYKNLILELIISVSIIFAQICKYEWCFNYSALKKLLCRYPFFNNLSSNINDTCQINHLIGFYDWITVPMAVAVFSATLICLLLHVFRDYRKPDNTNPQILFKTLNPFFWIRTSITGFIAIAQVLLVFIARLRF